jgi:ankyrin repeat protein
MSRALPLRADLDWLKKHAKERLAELRTSKSDVRLAEAQLAVAREYGFPSWRALKAHVEKLREAVDSIAPPASAAAITMPVAPDDPDLVRLFTAIAAGEYATVGAILSQRRELVNARDAEGQTPLHAAAWHNDPRLGAYLLALGADANARYGDSGHTPVSWAVTCHALEFARALVKLGAGPDLFTTSGYGDLEQVKSSFGPDGLLIEGASRTGSTRYGPDGARLPCPPSSSIEQVSDALYIACRNGQAEVVEYLLTKSPDLGFRAYMGATALHWAYFGGSRGVIDALLAAGADPTARDSSLQCTPRAFGICAPANWGFLELVQERLREDPSLASLDDGVTTPLHEAARSGSLDVIRALLDAGAPRDVRNKAGLIPAEVARASGHGEAAELLEGT